MATAGRRVAVAGVGYSHVGRNTGLSIDDHMIAATKAALADSGLSVSDIDGITSVGTEPLLLRHRDRAPRHRPAAELVGVGEGRGVQSPDDVDAPPRRR